MSPYETNAADTAPSAVLRRDCPQCNSKYTDAISLSHGSEEWPMVQCRICDFIYLTRAPRYEELSTTRAWEKTSIIENFLTQVPVKHEVAEGPTVFNALKIEIDDKTRKAVSALPIQRYLEE